MNAVAKRPPSDVGEPHAVSWSPAGMVWTGLSRLKPGLPPVAAAKDAGKDWERARVGGPVWAANAISEGDWDGLVKVGEVVIVVVVRCPADPMQQEVKGWNVESQKDQ